MITTVRAPTHGGHSGTFHRSRPVSGISGSLEQCLGPGKVAGWFALSTTELFQELSFIVGQ